MVDVTDVQGYQTKFENQRELLDTSEDVDEADREQIQRWIVHLRTNDPEVESLGTVVGHMNRIRLAAERSEMPLTEMETVEDINALKLYLEDEHGLGDGTIRNYMKAVRKFFEWLDVEWADDIVIGASIDRKHDPDEEITSDELGALLDACSQYDSAARDKALIALLRDTGLRIGAILSLQLKHVDIQGQRATITINEEAHVKDADGPKPLTWSRGYLANWLDIHPRPNNPEAALIHKTRKAVDDEHGALRQQYAGRRISKIAETAGLDPDRIHAHLFRGTAISEWIRKGMSDQKIKHRADWGEDSREIGTYSRVTDEELNDAIFEDYGIVAPENDTSPELEQCPQCRTPLRGNERFCPGCAAPLDSTTAEATEGVEDRTFEAATQADATNNDILAEFRRRFKNDPDFRDRVVSSDHDETSSS